MTLDFYTFDLVKYVSKLVRDSYREITSLLKTPEDLDEEKIDRFENQLDIVKVWIW